MANTSNTQHNEGEYIGHKFQEMLQKFGITSKPTTVKNPQSNAIIKRLNKRMACNAMSRSNCSINHKQLTNMIDNALATV